MSVAFRQLRVYLRGAFVLIVAIAVVVILLENRANTVSFWFFGLTDEQRPINVVWLIVCTSAGTLVAWWAVALAWRLRHDIRELRGARALDEAAKTLDKRAEALDQREKRIDDKVRRAIGEDGDSVGD